MLQLRSRFILRSMSTNNLPTTLMQDVHGTGHGKKEWRNKPLFRREGDRKFRTGIEASEMLYDEAVRRDPYQKEFLQTTKLFLNSICPVFDRYPKYAWVMKQLLEPERAVQFRVPWVDDTGNHRVCRGYRVQFSSALGPYMGGLRFHSETSHGTVKFLAFDNVFRNALSGQMFGGGAGGADFDPIGKSETEIMRFCQSYMTELSNYIGPNRDIPTPGVGVGQREIGYMFGQYKRLQHSTYGAGASGVVNDGNFQYPQANGYGVAFFAQHVIKANDGSLSGKRCVISGCGNTALHLAEKLLQLGATVLSFSDSSGYIVEPDGFTVEKLQELKKIKSERNARIGEYIMASTSAQYSSDQSIWDIPCDYAFPCSIQNNIDAAASTKLIENGCLGVFEGTNMSCTEEAIHEFQKNQSIVFAPWKVTCAGSLSLMPINRSSILDDELEFDKMLDTYMGDLYHRVESTAEQYNVKGDLMAGANIASFVNVAKATIRQGAV